MPDYIKICALGGLDEEGRDCYVVEINDDIFVLDCGISIPDKTIPGIDSLLPNFDYLVKNKSRIKAYIITHGHDAVMGALKYFYDLAPAPIYCTKATREYLVLEAQQEKMRARFSFNEVLSSSDVVIANRQFHFFQTCHNMCQSMGVAIETDRGNIIYTSDFIVDFTVKDKNFFFDLNAINKIAEKPTLLLLSESYCANLDGYCAPYHRTKQRLEKYFQEDKRIFISCFWENVFRIQEVLNLCVQYRRKVFLYDEYTYNLVNFMIDGGIVAFPKTSIVQKEDFLRIKREDLVIFMLGDGAEHYNEYVNLSMGRNEDKRIVLDKDDIFIIGAIPTAYYEIVSTKSIDSLYRTGCEVVWLKRKDVPAMHARMDDLKFFLSFFRPQYYLPVRGIYTNMIENAKLAVSMGIGLNHTNVFIVDNGMQLVFDDKPRPSIVPNEVNGINIAPILADGTGISHIGAEVINDRQKLGIDGVVVIAATVSQKDKKIIAGPDCQMRGFVFVKEAEPLLKSISKIYVDEVNLALSQDVTDFTQTENNIKDKARRFIKRENGREPLIIASVISV